MIRYLIILKTIDIIELIKIIYNKVILVNIDNIILLLVIKK